MKDYQKFQNKKVLVTGGAGFVGSYLCEDLLKYNNQVVQLRTLHLELVINIAKANVEVVEAKQVA
jgi:nucleoside-diphosphate-sugar epimerase